MVTCDPDDDDDDDDDCDVDDKEDRVMGSCDPESVRRCLRQARLPDSLKSCGETNFTDGAYFHLLFLELCLLTSSGILPELIAHSLPGILQDSSSGLIELLGKTTFTL